MWFYFTSRNQGGHPRGYGTDDSGNLLACNKAEGYDQELAASATEGDEENFGHVKRDAWQIISTRIFENIFAFFFMFYRVSQFTFDDFNFV